MAAFHVETCINAVIIGPKNACVEARLHAAQHNLLHSINHPARWRFQRRINCNFLKIQTSEEILRSIIAIGAPIARKACG